MKNIILLFFLFFLFNIQSQLDLKEIMKGHDFVGYLPENHYWNVDETHILFDWNPNSEPGNSLYAYSLKDKKTEKVDLKNIQIQIPFDEKQRLFVTVYHSQGGTLYSYNTKTKTVKIIYQSEEFISGIQRLADPNLISFRKGNNLFLYNANEGSIKQITNIESGKEKPKSVDTSFLNKQQDELFQYVRDQKNRKNWREKKNQPLFSFPKKWYYGEGNLVDIQLDPSNKFIAIRTSIEPETKGTQVEDYVTASGYSKSIQARAKVTNEEPTMKLAILNREKDSVQWVNFETLPTVKKEEKLREIFIHSLRFSESSNQALFDIRSADNKDRWIGSIELNTLAISLIDHQNDTAWIGGPGISSWNMEEGILDWLEDGKTCYFQSEESGFSHLYIYDLETKKIEHLTNGNFEIHGVQLSKDRNYFFLSANKTHPGNRDYYKFEIATKSWMPLLTDFGYHDVALSPDEKQLAIRYSSATSPWELYLAPAILNVPIKTQLTYSTTEKFKQYKWKNPEVISLKGSDNKLFYARYYEPKKELKNGAAVMFVHGAGYLQNAHFYWSNYFREYMFHNLLVDLGYTVIDVDYRASEGYGREYRTAIYRHMGGRDLEDFIDAKKWLVTEKQIDASRIGIYGGSYGGFITLMGLLTKPGEFACGAALRSVTDWAHYNHEYTSNILNYPETDPEAYRKSSPIYFAENLQDPLLMLHGMVDDNVQFQDVVRLSQRFIELGKKDWDLAMFPVENHGFKEAYSWYDEYRRIFELFEKHLKK
jgi:dipeptidyl aminopeptidase/acylaminoacyl peptidase